MKLLVPVLLAGAAFALSTIGSVSFLVTVLVLIGMLILAVYWPWPDVMRDPDFDAFERLLADEDSLTRAAAAEQEARQP